MLTQFVKICDQKAKDAEMSAGKKMLVMEKFKQLNMITQEESPQGFLNWYQWSTFLKNHSGFSQVHLFGGWEVAVVAPVFFLCLNDS